MEGKHWDIYTKGTVTQSITSKGTARKQIPAGIKLINLLEGETLLDLGSGISNRVAELCVSSNTRYLPLDPFNLPKAKNLHSISELEKYPADYVLISNVLNTVKEPSVWKDILLVAKDSCKEGAKIVITVYAGELLAAEKREKVRKKTPIATRDGWQNRMPLRDYLPTVQEIFPSAKVIGKAIIAYK